jgi:hypothetical protein
VVRRPSESRPVVVAKTRWDDDGSVEPLDGERLGPVIPVIHTRTTTRTMNRSIIAGLVAVPVLLVGCQSPDETSTTNTTSSAQTQDAIPASQQVVLKMTGMT